MSVAHIPEDPLGRVRRCFVGFSWIRLFPERVEQGIDRSFEIENVNVATIITEHQGGFTVAILNDESLGLQSVEQQTNRSTGIIIETGGNILHTWERERKKKVCVCLFFVDETLLPNRQNSSRKVSLEMVKNLRSRLVDAKTSLCASNM